MYIRKVKVKGKTYYQEVEAYWKDGKKKIKVIRHLGTTPPEGMTVGTNSRGRGEMGGRKKTPAPTKTPEPSSAHLEPGAVQLPLTIPLGAVEPTPPYIIREYAFTVRNGLPIAHPPGGWKGYRIIGSNGAWWPRSEAPKNFGSFEDAQKQLRELWRKGG